MKKNVYVSVSTDPVADHQEVCEYAKTLQGQADFLHCDIMDGVFVEKKSYDAQLVYNINQNSLIMLDVHLMCKEPLALLNDYIASGANIITIHYEAFENKNDIVRAVQKIKKANVLAGISFKPTTPVKEIKLFLHDFDVVLVMSVEPGASGQKFLEQSLDKIRQLDQFRRDNNFNFKIEVDGGVNSSNAKEIVEAGADMLVSGNYVFKAEDRLEAIESLKK